MSDWGSDMMQGPPIKADENEFEMKLAYAELYAKNPTDWQLIGYSIFPEIEDRGRALQCKAWRFDPVVVRRVAELQGPKEVASTLPTDDEIEAKAWQLAQSSKDEKIVVASLSMLMERRGMIKRGSQTQVNVDARTVNNVMRVPAKVSDADRSQWERDFKAQQNALVANG